MYKMSKLNKERNKNWICRIKTIISEPVQRIRSLEVLKFESWLELYLELVC